MTSLRVAVVDDHPMFRDGVVSTLSDAEGVEVVGDGATAEDAVRLAADVKPDVMLLDIGMPGGGLNALRHITKAGWPVSVIMISVSERTDDVLSAVDAGAKGYLCKGIQKHELVEALKGARRGRIAVDANFAIRIVHRAALEASVEGGLARLSVLERQVLDCIAQGLSNTETADRLHTALNVVRSAKAQIARKLSVKDRLEPALALLRALNRPRS